MSIEKNNEDTIYDIESMIEQYGSKNTESVNEVVEDIDTQEHIDAINTSCYAPPVYQSSTQEASHSHSTLQIVVLNVVGFILGWLTLCYGFPIIMKGINYIISIPVLGDLIRFGVEPAYIVFPYSAWIASTIAGFICYKICAPTRTNKRIGMIALGVAGVVQYTKATISLFRYNGYDFVFIVFAVSALIAVSLYFVLGFGRE